MKEEKKILEIVTLEWLTNERKNIMREEENIREEREKFQIG